MARKPVSQRPLRVSKRSRCNMSIGWEEVLAVVRGEMVGGELIVTSERNVKTSYGKFRDGQFVFSEAGLEFVRDYKSVGLVAAEEAAVAKYGLANRANMG